MRSKLEELRDEIILHSLNPHATSEDVSKCFESGFRGIYTKSLDKPFLDNHIFVMFDATLDKDWLFRETLFTKSIWFYDSFDIQTQYETYIVYAFINAIKVDTHKTLPLNEIRVLFSDYIKKSQGLSFDKS